MLRPVACALVLSLLPQIAFAYVGPGAGLSAIGTLVALLGVVAFALIGFIWYPVKRLLKARRATGGPSE